MSSKKLENGEWQGMTEDACEAAVDRAFSRDPTVKFMVQKLEEAGCVIERPFVQLEKCGQDVGGGFRPPDGIVLCYNHLVSQNEVNKCLVHELIHAYDHCRAANLDWKNCDHHACSEVRSASLSGDCSYKAEFDRGNFAFKGQHQVCVKRRAKLSLAMNAYCAGQADQAVERVFEKCFADTAPFDRRP